MLQKKFFTSLTITVSVMLFAGVTVMTADASHSWGNYHWARTANPFALKLGDNVSSVWDTYLFTTASDWNQSTVVDTSLVNGSTNPKNCKAVSGRVEVCSGKYGNNGWLGIANIWVSSSHITKGAVRVNDTYFNTAQYNTPAWRNLVMCQEVGHTLGLDHQDEIFDNANLGTCMDYTSDPLANQYPNAHDYEQLEAIYAHLDGFTTLLSGTFAKNGSDIDMTNPKEWGKEVRKDKHGKGALYARDFGKGNKIFTFVVWAE